MTEPNTWLPIGGAIALTAGLCVASVLACRRRWAPSLRAALLIAAAVRLAGLIAGYGHTPNDVVVYFQAAGHLVLERHDPLTHLHRFQWNFLPLMPYVFAIEIKTGLPWEIAGKLAAVLADLWTVAIIGRFARAGMGPRIRLLYALSPLAVLVTCVHGQVEPVSVALGLTALLLARNQRAKGSGAFLGLAIASKSWPVLFTVGVLRDLSPRRWFGSMAVAGVVVLSFLLSTKVILRDHLDAAVHVLASYRSLIGSWGWTGILAAQHKTRLGYVGHVIDQYQKIGTLLIIGGIALTLAIKARRSQGPDLVLAVMLAFLAATAGFGVQYLLWPCALAYAVGGRRTAPFLVLATAYAGFFYLVDVPGLVSRETGREILQFGSLPVIAAALIGLLWPKGGADELAIPAAGAGRLSGSDTRAGRAC